MNFPVWELPMGGGILMALVSVLHVFVAHLAVGGGLWLVLAEGAARRRGDAALLSLVKTQSRAFLLLTLVFGAITGVGIWTTAALISPQAILALIRAYVWGWAMEWVFFIVEIAAALVYWYGWDRLDARTHRIVGWIYFVAAYISLVIINGIVTFMLTPGGWLGNHEFWTGFFNPTYWPSLALRSAAAAFQAGLFVLVTVAFMRRGDARAADARAWATRHGAVWVAAGVAAFAAALFWYRGALTAAIPGWADLAAGAIPVLPRVVGLMLVGAAAAFLIALWPLAAPRRWHPAGAVLLTAAGLALFFGGEWVREAARKPYTIHGYLYTTGLRVDQEPEIAAAGVTAFTRWRDPAASTPDARGRDLYRAWCLPCHTRDGYNPMRPFLSHRTEAEIAEFLPRLHHMRARMPAWHGNAAETADLAAYLADDADHGAAVFPADPAAAARLAWDAHCGTCHTLDGYRALRPALAGSTREDFEAMLDALPDLAAEMPAYGGNPVERAHLLDFLTGAAGAAPDRSPE